MTSFKKAYIAFFLFVNFISLFSNISEFDIIVDGNGNGDFKTINSAINSLPMYNYQRVVIFIKNGIYNEKIRVDQDFITLLGESRDSTIIQYNLLREDWVNNKDEIGPAVINIHADNIILKNISVFNTQPQIGPHAFCVYGTGTRTILLNCNIISKGADAVALWNYKSGMYYHANCHFEGAVDLVCPRGWCFIINSSFFEVKKTAAIWHAGVTNENQKFVIKNSQFDGVEGFYLGRHHYEAQFYLINCSFSNNMIDKPIYRVTYPDNPEKDRPYFYGDRYYFYNCHRETEDYKWFKNNLHFPDSTITPSWTFDNLWDPEIETTPELINYSIDSNDLILEFSEILSIKGDVSLKTQNGKIFKFTMGKGRKTIMFSSNQIINESDIIDGLEVISGKIISSIATIKIREIKTIQF
ncbi:pectinesterase family protein [Bacteroidota bacterium]